MKHIFFLSSLPAANLYHINYKNIISQTCDTIEPGEIVTLLMMKIAKNVVIPITDTKIKICKYATFSFLYANRSAKYIYVYPGDSLDKLLGVKDFKLLHE